MKLTFLNGDKAGQTQELTPPGISVGRETDNDVQLLVGGVSRYHAKVEFLNGDWLIRDLGSTNGTKINGERVEGTKVLRQGDIVIMGDQTMRFGEPPSSSAAYPAAPPPASRQTAPVPAAAPNAPTLQEIPLPPPQSPQPQFIFQPSGNTIPRQTEAAKQDTVVPAPEPEKPESQAKSIFETLRSAVPTKLEGNIFGKSKDASAQGAAEQDAAGKKKGLFSGVVGNILFYVIVVGIAVICVSVFIMMQQESSKNASAAAKDASKDESSKQAFLLVYEKQKTTKDNVFRFTLTIENESVVFVLDDIQNNRHFYKSFAKANEVFLKELQESVRKSDFMKLQQDPAGIAAESGLDEIRTLTIAANNNLNKIVVHNSFAKSSFEEIEIAIDKFSEDYGLKTVSLSVEEMKEEASKAFMKAESLYENRDAKPENLRAAMLRYQLTMDYLDQFEPKPQEWNLARKRLQEAQTIQDKKLKELEFNLTQHYNLKDYREAAKDCQAIMDLVDPQNPKYKKAHDYKIALEKLVRSSHK